MEKKHRRSDKLSDENSIRHRTELFNQYVVPFKGLIFKLVLQYSFHITEIEDNFNEVLINFFKYIDTYDPKRPLQTWLHIVTKRYVMDLNIKRRNYKWSDTSDVNRLSDSFYEQDKISGNIMSMENYRQLYNDDILDALSRLKPIYRESLLLQQAGFKLEEIMNISYNKGNLKVRNIETVKSRLFLAKQQMRKLITRDGESRKK